MSVVRIEALRALAALIELEIPELAGRVCSGVAPSSELEEIPNVSINPTRWDFIPEQVTPHATLPGNVVVYEVGQHESPCVISIVAGTPASRWTIEARILDLFARAVHPLTGMSLPGVIVLAVSACPELSLWSASFDLDSDEWVDVGALDRRYESRIMTTATIPALTIRRPVYTIDQLILGVVAAPNLLPAPADELVTINVDGTIEPFTP